MKPVLAVLAAIVLSTPVFAQMEIGVNGGAVINNASISYIYNNHSESKSSGYRPGIAAEGMYNLKHWRFGIAAAYQQQEFTYTHKVLVGCFGSEVVTSTTNEKLVPLHLVVSRKFIFHSLEAYCGVAAGVVNAYGSDKVSSDAGKDTYKSHSSGFMSGAHAGFTWYITHNVGINTEVAANYMKVPGTYLQYDHLSYPITVGIRYKL